MSTPYRFHLPDLGEGLPDATIVEWFVKVGDSIRLDEPLISMETAKAVVEVPSPCSGRLLKIAGGPGDVIATGSVLAEFELDAAGPQRSAAQDTGHHHGAPAAAEATTSPSAAATPVAAEAAPTSAPSGTQASAVGGASAPTASAASADAGTVVGAMQVSDQIRSEQAVSLGGIKAMPAVRALARKLGVDLARVRPSGEGGVVTMADVKHAASDASALLPSPRGRGAGGEGPATPDRSGTPAPSPQPLSHVERGLSRTAVSASGKPMATRPPGAAPALGQPEPLRGVRRNMARVMAEANAHVVLTTIVDDADLHAWRGKQDITARLVRAIVAACRAVPELNAWLDGDKLTRTLHPHVDLGIAVDTPEGLFVPALRNANLLDAAGIRAGIERLRAQVADRSIPASELSGYTISLSNFGMFAGRYATPVVVPPCVAIVGAGRLSHDVVAVMGGVEVHRRLPLSLSFDHRACTGGEAARFLRALLDDLALPA
jgi:2-oxoisovalerate dehydrogenase E2 component (dihydrolipoyl transacylase)